MIYTPQMLNTFSRCPKEYYFKYIKKIPVPNLEDNFIVGKNIHAIAAYYLNGADISKYDLTKTEKKIWNNLLSTSYFNLKPIEVEINVSCKIDNYWIGGRVDAIVKNKHDNFYILDYKTGYIPENAEENFQTIIYLLAVSKMLKQCSDLNFVYISTKTNTVKEIKLTQKLTENYEFKIKNICDNINMLSKNFIDKNNKCDSCQYSKICI